MTKPTMRHLTIYAFLLRQIGQAIAAKDIDETRLGTYLTGIPVYRTVGNTNAVQVSIDGQDLNLTLSSSVDYILVAGLDCKGCVRDAQPYDPSQSSTWDSTLLALDYKYDNPYAHPGPRTAQQEDDPDSPQSPTLIDIDAVIGSAHIKDSTGDKDFAQKIAVVQRMTDADSGNATARFERGSSGIWGLGVDASSRTAKMMSIIPAVALGEWNFTVGLGMNPWSSDLTSLAGELHWGAVPRNAYEGTFNWIKLVGKGLFWSIPVDKLSMNGHGISAKGLSAIIDPGYNVIAVPFAQAQQLYSHVKGSIQHTDYPNRWTVPCDSQITFSIRLNSRTYNIPVESLIQRRTAQECWGSVVAWAAGTAPDQAGRVLIGTPFLAYFYTALYFDSSKTISYVGIAGKPGIKTQPTRNNNQRLSPSAMGGIISAVVIVVVFGLLACYYRQRDSPAGWYHRAMKRQHRIAVNQMKMVNPLAPTPHLLIGPPPIPDISRNQVYSKPFWKGFTSRNRTEGMMLDPHMAAFQQQQQQQQLMDQQREQADAQQGSDQHHRSGTHRHHHTHEEAPHADAGFLGRIRRLFGPGGSSEPADYHSARHRHDGNRVHHSRHASEHSRTTPGHSRAHSTSSRHHRDARQDSYDEGTHSFSGFAAEDSFHHSLPNRHGQQPHYGPTQDQWGHAPPMPVANHLFFDPARHPQHVGGPMIHNGPHEAYELGHVLPYHPGPAGTQQETPGYFQRMFR